MMRVHLVDGPYTPLLPSGDMATPPGTKTVRVSLQTHEKLMDLADRINGSADDALAFLLGTSTVRVPISDIQRNRWSEAAAAAGVSLSEFVRMRVEAAIEYGADPQGLQRIYEHVQALTAAAGVRPIPVVRPSTPRTQGVDK